MICEICKKCDKFTLGFCKGYDEQKDKRKPDCLKLEANKFVKEIHDFFKIQLDNQYGKTFQDKRIHKRLSFYE